ncbi:hypothetical protein [Thiomicrorhabdus indica]|uniref:hypothetical protein n=1 Tax=Thiomicrorhabdus indica TaxID=2267253 RepID=UPI00102DF668|nr:hypothetical protein [Thiomicrorhabdus indica]
MQTLNAGNLTQFRMIDEINAGYIELKNGQKLQHKLEKLGGSVTLKPIEKLNFRASEKLVVKCQQTGNFFQAEL